MNSWPYLIYTLLLFVLSLIYFRFARKYKIVDLPNHRTMHEGATIRGGGIVVFIGVLIYSFFLNEPSIYFSCGLLLIGVTGFLDDLIDLPSKIRFPIQVFSIVLILAELDMLGDDFLLLFVIVIVAAGILNAYNFMDGINGISGGYGLITVLSLLYVNNYIQYFIPNQFLIFFILALLVFNYFNFRTKAVCFAGDVGSLSIAFIIIYLIIKLINESQQVAYIFFLTAYGIDTIFTIVQRLARKENIFEAHRLHLFQVAVSKTRMPHLFMTLIYVGAQAIINFIVILLIPMAQEVQLVYLGVLLVVFSVIYIAVKRKMMPDSI